ncbi:MAG: DUF2945 domain-containing protein [Sphingopyxis sp.]|nr:DUF2945 domain-containing protein [Sphingopyxis sp.]
MKDEPKKGDEVTWKSHGGRAEGKVVRKVTKAMDIKGHHVAASPTNPEYLVETAEGKRAAHKDGALKRKAPR